jgi:hypothetical protein
VTFSWCYQMQSLLPAHFQFCSTFL